MSYHEEPTQEEVSSHRTYLDRCSNQEIACLILYHYGHDAFGWDPEWQVEMNREEFKKRFEIGDCE